MRTLFRTALALGALACAAFGAGAAGAQQAVSPDGSVIFLPDGSSFYNQNSLNLPSMTMPYGQDEVQGAGGVSCRSSVASGGPYVDFGMIGSNDLYDRQAASVYGRVVVPLGKRPERLDCARLYELEIERLQMELEMARMGLGMMMPPDSAPAIARVPQQAPAQNDAQADIAAPPPETQTQAQAQLEARAFR